MQQYATIARVGQRPAHAALDEPCGALDHQTRELMQELLPGIRVE